MTENNLSSLNIQASDSVQIKGLKVDAVIGVFAWERAITQPLMIDVILYTDIKKASASDDINDAINYKSVCDDITKWCQDTEAKLIEYLAEVIAKRLLESYEINKVDISVAKPTAIAQADSVGVCISRYKQ